MAVAYTVKMIRSLLLLLIAVFSLIACRSAYVETTIDNSGPAALRLIEVDYPSASFGTQTLDAHVLYHYRFKVQGSSPVTITWTGADGKPHTASGPTLTEGQQGTLRITVDSASRVSWTVNLSGAR